MVSSSFPLSCLVLLGSACPFYDAETGSEENEQPTIQLQLLMNELVRDKLTKQKSITIKLPKTATYYKLKKKILGKGYQLTSWAKKKKGSHRVKIFKHPPLPFNRLQIEYGKTLLEQGIRDSDLLYAIVSNKNDKKNNTITFFVDHQYSDKIITLVMKKDSSSAFKEKEILTLANNVFMELSEENENKPEKSLLRNNAGNTHLLYPPEIMSLYEHDSNEVAIGQEKPIVSNLLEDGDLISIRSTPPKPVTVTIKTTDHEKVKTIEGVFYSNAYPAHILQYITNRLHWNIEHRLFVVEEEADDAFSQPEQLEEINLGIRLERSAYFANKFHIVVYVKSLPTINDGNLKEKKKQRPFNKNRPNYAPEDNISMVISKLATSDTVLQQNPTSINIKPLKEKNVYYLKIATEKILEHHRIQYNNNEKLKNRLMIYVAGQYKKFKRIATKPRLDNTYPLLVNQRVELGDRIYVIIPSQKDPHQVSFFVQNERSSKVALITTTIDRKAISLKQKRKINEIHQKMIQVFQRLERNDQHEDNLPLWDEDVLEKTKLDLEGKQMATLQNGDLIKLVLHPAYYIDITLSTKDETLSVELTGLPLDMKIGKLIKKAKEKAFWLNEQVKNPLWVELNDHGMSFTKQLHFDQSLQEAGITENEVLYLITDIVEERKISDQDNELHHSLQENNNNSYTNDAVIEAPKNDDILLPSYTNSNIIKKPNNDDALPTKPNTFKQQPNNIQSIQLNRFSNKGNDAGSSEGATKNQSNNNYNTPLVPIAGLGIALAGWVNKASNWFKHKGKKQNTDEVVSSEANISTDAYIDTEP